MDRNASIHGLRGLAVLAVFVYHVHRSLVSGGFELHADAGSAAFRLLESGRLGVDLFFLISGYLITASLLRHRSAPAFLWSRAVRIYPAFLPPHLLAFTLGPLIGYGWMADLGAGGYLLHFVSNLLLLPGVFDLPIAQIVAWSLSYELAFYLLAAAGWQCFAEQRLLRRALLSVLWAAAAGWMLWHHPRAWFFVAGALVYGVMKRSRRPALTIPLAVLELPALLLMGLLFERAFPLSVVCGAIAFASVAFEAGPLARCLRSRPLQFLGNVSYSFYLWHAPVLFVLKQIFADGTVGNPYWTVALFGGCSAVGSVALAYVSWRLVEQGAWSQLWPALRGADRDTAAIAVWRRALEQTRLEDEAQGVTMEVALRGRPRYDVRAAVLNEQETMCDDRKRGSGQTGDRTQAGGQAEDSPEEATTVCADRS